MRSSTPGHWQRFWEQADRLELDDVYGTDGRMVREITGIYDGDPAGLRGRRILEVGAGTGRDAVALAAAGAQVLTIDYVPGSLGLTLKAAAQARADVSAVCGDGLAMPFADGSFDVVFHQGLLEHFRPAQAEALLKENIRVLKKGGLLLVDVPQRYHIYTVIKHALIAVDKWFAGWEREFSVAELRTIMTQLGLEPIHTYGEWMYPSLFYRASREALLKVGVKLPLYPTFFGPLSSARKAIRESLRDSALALNTSLSFGIIGKK